MGDMADYYADIAINQMGEEEALREFDRQRAKDTLEEYTMGIATWETNAGDEIMVVEMTDIHVKNCLEFMRKKKEKSDTTLAWIKIFRAEVIKRKM